MTRNAGCWGRGGLGCLAGVGFGVLPLSLAFFFGGRFGLLDANVIPTDDAGVATGDSELDRDGVPDDDDATVELSRSLDGTFVWEPNGGCRGGCRVIKNIMHENEADCGGGLTASDSDLGRVIGEPEREGDQIEKVREIAT